MTYSQFGDGGGVWEISLFSPVVDRLQLVEGVAAMGMVGVVAAIVFRVIAVRLVTFTDPAHS